MHGGAVSLTRKRVFQADGPIGLNTELVHAIEHLPPGGAPKVLRLQCVTAELACVNVNLALMSAGTEHSVCIIGAGAAGLITAYTLIGDGFRDVQVFEKAGSPGGVFSASRIYPGLHINKYVALSFA